MKLTREQIEEIAVLRDQGRKWREIGKLLGCGAVTACNAFHHQLYRLDEQRLSPEAIENFRKAVEWGKQNGLVREPQPTNQEITPP